MKKLIAMTALLLVAGCGAMPSILQGVASGLTYGVTVSTKPVVAPPAGPVEVVLDPATGKMELRGVAPQPIPVTVAPGAVPQVDKVEK